MGEATSTALLAILIIAGTLYGTLRWIVQDEPPSSSVRPFNRHHEENRGPSRSAQ